MSTRFEIDSRKDKRGFCRILLVYSFRGKQVRISVKWDSGDLIKIDCNNFTKLRESGGRKQAYRIPAGMLSSAINARLDYLENIVARTIIAKLNASGQTPSCKKFKEKWDLYFSDNNVLACYDLFRKRKKNISKSHRNNISKLRAVLVRFERVNGSLAFNDFGRSFPDQLAKLETTRGGTYSSSSLRQMLYILKDFLSEGLIEKWHRNDGFKAWNMPASQNREFYLEEWEIIRLEKIELPKHLGAVRDMALFLFLTSVRRGELETFEEVQGESELVRVFRYKLSKLRHGKEEWVYFRPSKTVLNLWDKYDGAIKIYSWTQFNRQIKRIAKMAGIAPDRAVKISAHSLRHSFITQARQAGFSVDELREQTGHKSAKIVGVYDHSVIVSGMQEKFEEKFRNG